jgi:hypothetical protein
VLAAPLLLTTLARLTTLSSLAVVFVVVTVLSRDKTTRDPSKWPDP